MDNLADLPYDKDQKLNPNEREYLIQTFGRDSDSKSSSTMNWKRIGIIVGAFAILANPFIDSILSSIPYLENSILSFLVKLFIFTIITIIAQRFVKNKS